MMSWAAIASLKRLLFHLHGIASSCGTTLYLSKRATKINHPRLHGLSRIDIYLSCMMIGTLFAHGKQRCDVSPGVSFAVLCRDSLCSASEGDAALGEADC